MLTKGRKLITLFGVDHNSSQRPVVRGGILYFAAGDTDVGIGPTGWPRPAVGGGARRGWPPPGSKSWPEHSRGCPLWNQRGHRGRGCSAKQSSRRSATGVPPRRHPQRCSRSGEASSGRARASGRGPSGRGACRSPRCAGSVWPPRSRTPPGQRGRCAAGVKGVPCGSWWLLLKHVGGFWLEWLGCRMSA